MAEVSGVKEVLRPGAAFPDFVTCLPRADIPLEGVEGRISQAADHQILFFDIAPIGELPLHHHGAQWGIVVDGEMDLTIDGATRTYRQGDSYFIPAGVAHAAAFRTRVRVIDVFADVARYTPLGDDA
ncbi:MAG: cupin domain-containing protein [Deltaproteobacteria bacterium]|nr:cupin domain-containing protein [Deltaproteobacteria bacterium]